jgi:polyferredoxin
MNAEWSVLPKVIFSWKYLLFMLFAAAGWFWLSRNRPMRGQRLLFQAADFILFGGLLGLTVPWVAKAFSIHPSPICAFGKGVGLAVTRHVVGMPMLALIGVVILVGLIGGKAFCGWACPMGALQELLGRIPGLRRIRLPFALTNGVRIAMVAVFLVVLLAWEKISYDYYNPFEVLHWSEISKAAIWAPAAVVAAASLIVYRPFCAFICPVGLVSWLAERVSFGRIRLSGDCNACGACVKETDCQALPALVQRKALVPDCHGCGDCLGACPKQAIRFGWRA